MANAEPAMVLPVFKVLLHIVKNRTKQKNTNVTILCWQFGAWKLCKISLDIRKETLFTFYQDFRAIDDLPVGFQSLFSLIASLCLTCQLRKVYFSYLQMRNICHWVCAEAFQYIDCLYFMQKKQYYYNIPSSIL